MSQRISYGNIFSESSRTFDFLNESTILTNGPSLFAPIGTRMSRRYRLFAIYLIASLVVLAVLIWLTATTPQSLDQLLPAILFCALIVLVQGLKRPDRGQTVVRRRL